MTETRADGEKISHIHLTRLWPLPAKELGDLVRDSKRLLVAENNSLGQLDWLLRAGAGLRAERKILKYDGRPFSVDDILKEYD